MKQTFRFTIRKKTKTESNKFEKGEKLWTSKLSIISSATRLLPILALGVCSKTSLDSCKNPRVCCIREPILERIWQRTVPCLSRRAPPETVASVFVFVWRAILLPMTCGRTKNVRRSKAPKVHLFYSIHFIIPSGPQHYITLAISGSQFNSIQLSGRGSSSRVVLRSRSNSLASCWNLRRRMSPCQTCRFRRRYRRRAYLPAIYFAITSVRSCENQHEMRTLKKWKAAHGLRKHSA